MFIQDHIHIEIGTQNRILQLQRELIIILMRIHALNLIFDHTGDRLHFLRSLVQQLRGELGVNNLTNKCLVIIAIDCHNVIHQLEGIAKKIFSFIHDELIITHTTIGLRDGNILEELITILILDDDFHRI